MTRWEECRATLAATEHLAVKDLPGGGFQIVVQPYRQQLPWALIIILFVVGIAGSVGGLLLLSRWNSSDPVSTDVTKIVIYGFVAAALAPLLALLRLVNGPTRPVILEAYPGRLRADRYISGDHVVREYGAGQVQCLFLEDGLLYVQTSIGQMPLIGFGKDDVNRVIGLTIAMRLWQPEELFIGDSGARRLKRTVILPKSRVGAKNSTA